MFRRWIGEWVFGSEKSSDWRLIYQLEGKYYDYYYRTLKYNKQKEGTTYSKVNDEMIPMIRMSEVYYIAAEAIYKTDPALAQKYLSSVKKEGVLKMLIIPKWHLRKNLSIWLLVMPVVSL